MDFFSQLLLKMLVATKQKLGSSYGCFLIYKNKYLGLGQNNLSTHERSVEKAPALHSNAAFRPSRWKNPMTHDVYCTRTSAGQGCYCHSCLWRPLAQAEASSLPSLTCLYTDSVQLNRLFGYIHKNRQDYGMQKHKKTT